MINTAKLAISAMFIVLCMATYIMMMIHIYDIGPSSVELATGRINPGNELIYILAGHAIGIFFFLFPSIIVFYAMKNQLTNKTEAN